MRQKHASKIGIIWIVWLIISGLTIRGWLSNYIGWGVKASLIDDDYKQFKAEQVVKHEKIDSTMWEVQTDVKLVQKDVSYIRDILEKKYDK